MDDLIKLLPEGASVVAVIIVIVLFLRQQREQAKDTKEITLLSTQKIESISTTYQTHIDRLFLEVQELKKESDAESRNIINRFIELSNDNIKILQDLRASIENKKTT